MDLESLRFPMRVRDRKTKAKATIESIRFMPEYGMYMVTFTTFGWLLLDHAIEQYEKAS